MHVAFLSDHFKKIYAIIKNFQKKISVVEGMKSLKSLNSIQIDELDVSGLLLIIILFGIRFFHIHISISSDLNREEKSPEKKYSLNV